jgi:hypothetical protein
VSRLTGKNALAGHAEDSSFGIVRMLERMYACLTKDILRRAWNKRRLSRSETK